MVAAGAPAPVRKWAGTAQLQRKVRSDRQPATL